MTANQPGTHKVSGLEALRGARIMKYRLISYAKLWAVLVLGFTIFTMVCR